jgi:carbonic anhydrase
VPHENEVAIFLVGRDTPRHVHAASVEELSSGHLWSDQLRFGAVTPARPEQLANPRRLLADVLVRGDLSSRDMAIEEIVKRGASMEEIAQLKEPVAGTPSEAIQALKRGNSRYFSGYPSVQNMSPIERRAQTLGQTPFAVVVGCSDSRVPIEIVFDQGPGNLFIIRVAGNVMGTLTLGSIEYAVNHLKSHLVVVLGHEGCGAVAASLLPPEARAREADHIRAILDRIVPGVDGMPRIRDVKARMREAVVANVRQQVHVLRQAPVIKQAVEAGRIAVVGAYYSISSGGVDFFESEEDLRVEPRAAAEAAAAR